MAKLPLNKKIFYGIGQLGVTIPAFFISTYIFIFYSPLQGTKILDASVVGIAMFLGTLVQAIANPFIGNWSDKLKFKVGRRRFFILTGFIPLSLFFALIWFPFFSGIIMAVLLFVYLLGFNFLFAYVVLPYLALIPEISTESGDRVVLTTISAYFSIAGIIIASILPAILLLLGASLSEVGLILALITLLSFFLVFISVRESTGEEKMPKEYSVLKAFIQTFRNKTFTRYIVAYLFFQFGFYFFLTSLGYYVENIVMPGYQGYKTYIGLFTLVAVIFTIIFSPLLVWYTRRRGEKRSFILFTTILGLVMISTFFVGLTRILSNTVQMLIVMIFAGLGLTSYFILPNAIISEIIDEDEILTGYRREGMYFGVQGLLERIPSGLSSFALGIWITYLYYPSSNDIYIRLLGVVGGISIIITAILFIFVPLKEGVRRNG
ncbi:MAG: MFS transporter [Thermoplasmata archaeon]|jgi:GPH family glycoside/pentoside/hexuronide:cation symporter|nr:MFS transporter [Thermoplasmatales archaeon]